MRQGPKASVLLCTTIGYQDGKCKNTEFSEAKDPLNPPLATHVPEIEAGAEYRSV